MMILMRDTQKTEFLIWERFGEVNHVARKLLSQDVSMNFGNDHHPRVLRQRFVTLELHGFQNGHRSTDSM
jgi:hypothetical protein